jgi:hypothetical protein
LTASPGAWQTVERTHGGHANDLFYASVRDLSIVVGADNAGAVALYWPVAQQTAVRNVNIDLSASGAIGLDMAGEGFALRAPAACGREHQPAEAAGQPGEQQGRGGVGIHRARGSHGPARRWRAAARVRGARMPAAGADPVQCGAMRVLRRGYP